MLQVRLFFCTKTLWAAANLLSNIETTNIFAVLVTEVSGNKCSADAMSRCTDPLKVVTDNKDLGFATSKDELDEMCP